MDCPDWTGKTVACLATGAGLTTDVVSAVREAGIPTIAINDAYRLAPWADLLLAWDSAWWMAHYHTTPKACRKIGVERRGPWPPDDVFLLTKTGDSGFDPDWPNARTGRNSGYGAVHVAMQARATRILLCGYNMGGAHFFGDHPRGLRNTASHDYAKMIREYRGLAKAAADRGVEVLNCTPSSALPWFEFCDIQDALGG
jgi:hypothetical protein